MLFLGAGASRAVGLPDMRDLTIAVNARLEKEGYGQLIRHITDTLEHANRDSRFFNQGEIDIEVIFSVLNGRINPVKTLKELGPFAIYINELGGNPTIPFEETLRNEQELERIRRIIGEVITTNCSNPDTKRALSYYTSLFEFKKDLVSQGHERLFNHIVTTNYDLVIERCAFENPQIPWRTGFKNIAGTTEFYLPLQEIFLDEIHPNEKIE
jgi:hypothetical protein